MEKFYDKMVTMTDNTSIERTKYLKAIDRALIKLYELEIQKQIYFKPNITTLFTHSWKEMTRNVIVHFQDMDIEVNRIDDNPNRFYFHWNNNDDAIIEMKNRLDTSKDIEEQVDNAALKFIQARINLAAFNGDNEIFIYKRDEISSDVFSRLEKMGFTVSPCMDGHIARIAWESKQTPVSVKSWYATYYKVSDYNGKRITTIF